MAANKHKDLYNVLRSKKLKPELIKDLSCVVQGKKVSIPKEQFVLARKIALGVSEEEFVKFVAKGEIPAMKLNQREMQMLNGGFWLIDVTVGAILDWLDDKAEKSLPPEPAKFCKAR